MKVVHYLTENGEDPYQQWVERLRDLRARIAVLRRIDRAVQGNFGDHKACRDGVCELRIDHGPGYRVYYFQHGELMIILLCGGDKSSQRKDIDKAVEYKADFLRRFKEEEHG